MSNSKKELTGPEKARARGQRLRALRNLTLSSSGKPLSRANIQRKYGLSSKTLKNWEYGHGTGLTEKGARRVLNIYQKENIECSLPWLMQGIGSPPNRIDQTLPIKRESSDPLATMDQETQYFESLHPESVIFTVKDDAMLPFYKPGDRVGGIRHYAQQITKLIDHDCIVETSTGEVWLRLLQNSTIPGQYNLYALNPRSKIERPTLYSVEIISAAPVIRHWRGKKWTYD